MDDGATEVDGREGLSVSIVGVNSKNCVAGVATA
jgi:hypothetical protein